jgi:LPS export ABC transporter protein LptC
MRGVEPLLMFNLNFARALAIAAGGILVAGLAGAEESPGLRVSGMTFVGSRGDQGELVVRSDTAFFHPDSGLADLQVVRAQVSDAKKGESFQLECDRAELDIETNDFTATGNVRGLTGDGQRYSAPWVRYEHASSTLSTDAPVTVVDSGVTFSGDGFRYHIEERRFELLGNVLMERAP